VLGHNNLMDVDGYTRLRLDLSFSLMLTFSSKYNIRTTSARISLCERKIIFENVHVTEGF
jgi:hypothetical protein